MKVQLHHRVPSWVCFTLYYKNLSRQLQASTDPTQSCRGIDKLFAILKWRGLQQKNLPLPEPSFMTNTTAGSPEPDESSQNVTGNSLSVTREMCSEFAWNDITDQWQWRAAGCQNQWYWFCKTENTWTPKPLLLDTETKSNILNCWQICDYLISKFSLTPKNSRVS